METNDWQVRTALLVGRHGVERLARARVAVVGVGGVGSHAAEALVRSGVGSVLLLDPDCVAWSNVNRQLQADSTTVGTPKVRALAERLLRINPAARVTALAERYDEDGGHATLREWQAEYVIDAIDSVPAKVALIHDCVERGVRLVSSMGAARRVQPERVWLADISETRVCPLAREMRRRLRSVGIVDGVAAVYSDEPARAIHGSGEKGAGEGAEAGLGSYICVPGVFGYVCASWVLRCVCS